MIRLYCPKSDMALLKKGYPDIETVIVNEFGDGVRYKPHVHSEAEVCFLLKGNSTQWVNGKEYDVKKGDLIVLNKGDLHAEISQKKDAARIMTCVLTKVQVLNLAPGKIIPDNIRPIVDTGDYFEDVLHTFYELYYDFSKQDTFAYEISRMNAAKLLLYIHRLIGMAFDEKIFPESNGNLTKEIKRYIDQNYMEEITLDSLAEKFFVSSFHIVHEMKKEIGESPIQYLIERRIGEAQRLLFFTEEPIQLIAEKVGYTNVSYFSRLFYKKTGYSPSAFREMHVPPVTDKKP